MTSPRTASSLDVFRDPVSVAVVGASADPGKWGNWLARGAMLGSGRRRVYLVNRHGTPVGDVATSRSIAELPEAPELVALCVPAAQLDRVVDEALERGTRGFLAITAGLDQASVRTGAERELAARIRAGGGRIIGPNCLGIYDAETDLQLAWGSFTPGALGIVSQSGQLGSEIADLAADVGLGVSRFVSIGNQVDVTAEEAVADLVDHDRTRLIALYMESFGDGRRLVETLQRLRAAGKPTVLLTVGGSDASRDAARSHTGALTSSLEVVDAACRAAGCIRVGTPAQLIDVARAVLGAAGPPRGPRVAIVGDSGGQGAIAADVATGQGLTVAPLPAEVGHELTALLPPGAAVDNPVDLAGAGERDLTAYAQTVRLVAGQPTVDAVVMTGYFGSYGANAPALAEIEAEVARDIAAASIEAGCPVVVHSMSAGTDAIAVLEDHGVATFRTIDGAVTGLAGAARLATHRGRPLPGRDGVSRPVAPGYWAARCTIADAGIAYPPAARVSTEEDVMRATDRIPGPYVLKADWLEHRTEHGGVVTGLADLAAVRAAYRELTVRLGRGDFVLEQLDTRADTVDLVVGARRDPAFGVVVLVGAGGTDTEVSSDTSIELAPIDGELAHQMLERLRCAPLLHGWRGRPPVDTGSVAVAMTVVADLLATDPSWSVVEINPLRVGPDGASALDALIVPTAGTGAGS